jgi:GMP synthase (glutamine-hydrolysing)
MSDLLHIVVVEGNTAADSEAMRRSGGEPFADSYARLLEALDRRVRCSIIRPCEDGLDPFARLLDAGPVHGVAWTGSHLSIYDGTPPVQVQLALAERVFAAEVPVFGSCWGNQVGAAALGGAVRRNPAGRELGVARDIRLTDAGARHPLLGGRSDGFPAFAVHLDEVARLPGGGVRLAGNAVSEVQAFAYERGGVSFWGVQYHPEFTPAVMAQLSRLFADRFIAEGHFEDRRTLDAEARRLEGFHGAAPPDATCFGAAYHPDWADPARRTLELANWLRHCVAPQA